MALTVNGSGTIFKKCDRSLTTVPTRTRAARLPPVSIRAIPQSVASTPRAGQGRQPCRGAPVASACPRRCGCVSTSRTELIAAAGRIVMREPVVASGHQRAGPAAEQAVLLVYAAAFLAITFFLVHWIEDAALARASGSNLRTTATRCPAGGPACHAEHASEGDPSR